MMTPDDGHFYTYVYLNPLKNNQPFYVGKGKDDRAMDHLRPCHKGENPHKDRTINKIRTSGHEPFIACAWQGPNEADAFWIERFLIAVYGTRYDDTGILTNLTKGGEGSVGWIPTDTTKQRISQGLLGKTLGIPRAPFTEEHKRNLSNAKKGIPSPMKGKRMSEGARKKVIESHKSTTKITDEQLRLELANGLTLKQIAVKHVMAYKVVWKRWNKRIRTDKHTLHRSRLTSKAIIP